MSAPGLDPTERMPVPPAPVTTGRIGAPSARSLTALVVVALVVVAAIALRPRPSAGDAASTAAPTAATVDGEPTPGSSATATGAPATPFVEPTSAATLAISAAPTDEPATPKPTKHPTPTPEIPATFTATVTVTPSCSTSPGMEGVSLMAAFSGPDFITRVVLSVDGVQVGPVDFDQPGLQVGGAGSGTSVTPDVAHEATASFYSGASGDVLVKAGVSSGTFTVALTADCA